MIGKGTGPREGKAGHQLIPYGISPLVRVSFGLFNIFLIFTHDCAGQPAVGLCTSFMTCILKVDNIVPFEKSIPCTEILHART